MQIVIDISEETYEYWKTHKYEYVISEAITNGIVLPKGHGDLVDKDTITVEEDVYFQNYIIHAPTIIPADKGED